jgi:hypothetical protein
MRFRNINKLEFVLEIMNAKNQIGGKDAGKSNFMKLT